MTDTDRNDNQKLVVRYEVWTGYPYDPVFPDTVLETGTSEATATKKEGAHDA